MTPTAKRRVDVGGPEMAYVEAGTGPPIVLLHGNPTSSFLWRQVIPHLATIGRCLAPDLVGMGDSEKLSRSGDGDYRLVDHRRWLATWMEAVGATEDVTLVLHDWGGPLGFDWARRHPGATRAIAYMETIVTPLEGAALEPGLLELFTALRAPGGEGLVLEHNLFIEQVLRSGLGGVAPATLAEYRRPFRSPGEHRRPMLAWAREVPIDGRPRDVHDLVAAYSSWLASSTVPKLFVNAEPGAALTGAAREACRRWPNQQEVTVAAGHFVPEDLGEELGSILAGWLRDLSARNPAVA